MFTCLACQLPAGGRNIRTPALTNKDGVVFLPQYFLKAQDPVIGRADEFVTFSFIHGEQVDFAGYLPEKSG